MYILSAVQISLAAVVLAHGLWWTVLSATALRGVRRSAPDAATSLTLTAIVPAHNEARLIAATLRSLRAASVGFQTEILVVADNCGDDTATLARLAGASVIERRNPVSKGKPAALSFALDYLASRQTTPDAIAVIDADTEVSPGFIQAVTARLSRGAEAVQVYYAAGPATSDLGRLRRLAFMLAHWTRPLGASRLGLGTTLKGNGMAFAWRNAAAGLSGRGVTEDAESTLELARRGVVIDFEPTATVSGYMAQTYAEAATQDRRWEGGRFRLTGRALTVAGGRLRHGDWRTAAAAFEVASLPLTIVVAAAGLALATGIAGIGSLTFAAFALGSVGAYGTLGLAAARAPMTDVRSLVSAPRFVLYKLRTYSSLARGRSSRHWEPTSRT